MPENCRCQNNAQFFGLFSGCFFLPPPPALFDDTVALSENIFPTPLCFFSNSLFFLHGLVPCIKSHFFIILNFLCFFCKLGFFVHFLTLFFLAAHRAWTTRIFMLDSCSANRDGWWGSGPFSFTPPPIHLTLRFVHLEISPPRDFFR